MEVEEEGKTMYVPCEKGNIGAMPMTWDQVPRSMIREPDVLRDDVFAVVKKAKASVVRANVERHEEWTTQFGSEGS